MDKERRDEPRGERIVSAHLVASVEEAMAIATLRYFDRAGSFAETVQAVTGAALQGPLTAAELSDAQLILAWRSPTETLCIARSAAGLAELIDRLAGAAEGCAVDLTGGVRIVRLTGTRIAELLSREILTGRTDVPGALMAVLPRLEGAFSLVLLDQGRVVALRDPNGFRPLCLGRLDAGWVVASE